MSIDFPVETKQKANIQPNKARQYKQKESLKSTT